MKKKLLASLAALCLFLASAACAEGALPGGETDPQEIETQAAEPQETEAPAEGAQEEAAQVEAPAIQPLELTTEYRWFVNRYKTVRGVTVTYYDDVYAVNHGKYGLTPFSDVVPSAYFVVDGDGYYAVAPVVLDIADAMRVRLYGGDTGELGLLYGQYCERVRGTKGRVGFSGIHEGVDFIAKPGQPLYAILGGVVTRAGDSNGTVGIYNETYDVTLLYLHCEKIAVRRGDVLEAGAPIAVEGKRGSGSAYTHVEMRDGRHTSSSAYRDTKIESDCPYSVMMTALGVVESGREPVTYAAALEAERQRLAEAEAARLAEQARIAAEQEAERQRIAAEEAARAEEEARKQAEQLQPEPTPGVPLIDALPDAADGYGFADETPSAPTATPSPTATPVPEATLPPANP